MWAYVIKIWQFLLYLLLVLLQPNSVWVLIIISKEGSSENVGLLYSRSMSQLRLKFSVNVSLDDILCIAEPFVTKPSTVRYHYKPERHTRKMDFIFKVKVTVTEFRSYNQIWLFLLYVLNWWFCWATNLVWQCMFISWSVLWKDCFAVFKIKVTVKVLNFSECLPGQHLWSVRLSMVMHHHQPEYHSETSFCDVQGQCTIVSTRSSCNGVEWSKDRTQAAESIKWRPQQAYSSNQVLLAQPQTIFSTPKILTLTHR